MKVVGKTVGEQWERDRRRLACFYKHGYSVVIVGTAILDETQTSRSKGLKMKLIEKHEIPPMVRWDLEIDDTHNFVAEGIVVHNTQCRIGIIDGLWQAGSKDWARKVPNDPAVNWYWFPSTLNPVCELLNSLAEQHKVVILYGETYGAVQTLRYGIPGKLGFRAFDLFVGNRFVDYDEFLAKCLHFGVEVVPVIEQGPFSLARAKELSEGKSQIPGADHIREGIVIHPIKDLRTPSLGRVVMKYVSDTYLGGKDHEEDTTDA